MAAVRSVGLKKQEPIEIKDDNESDSELEALRIAALKTIRQKSPPHAIPYISSQTSNYIASQPVVVTHKKKPGFRRYNKSKPQTQSTINPNLISIVPTNTDGDDAISSDSAYQRSLESQSKLDNVDSLPLPQNRYCNLLKPAANEKKKEVSTKFSRIDASDSESDDDDLLKGKFSSDEDDDKPKKDVICNENKESNDNEDVDPESSVPKIDDDEDSLDRLMDVMEQEFIEKPKKVPISDDKSVKDLKSPNNLNIVIKKEIPDDDYNENVVPETETIIYKAKKIKTEKIDDGYVDSVLLASGREGNSTGEKTSSIASTSQDNDPLPTFRKLSGAGLKQGILVEKKISGIINTSVGPCLKIRSPSEVNLKFTPKESVKTDSVPSVSVNKNVYVNILSDENSMSNTESVVKTEIIDDVVVEDKCKSPSPVENSKVSISDKTENTKTSLNVGNKASVRLSDNVNEGISLQSKSRVTRSRSRENIQIRRSISPRRNLSPRRYDTSPRTRRSPLRDRSFSPRPARGPIRRSYTPRRSRSPLPYSKSPLHYKRYSRSRSPLRRRSRSWSRSASYSRSRSRSPYLRYRSRSPYRRSVSRSPRPAGRYSSPRRVLSPRRNSLSPVRRDYLPIRRYSPGRRKSMSPKRRSPFYYRQVSPTFISRAPNRLTPPPRVRNSSLSPKRRSPLSQSIRRSISPRRPTIKYDSYSPKRARLSISPVTRPRKTVSPRRRISPLRSARSSMSPKRQFSPGRSPKRMSVSPWKRSGVSPKKRSLLSPRNRSPVSPRKRSPLSPRKRSPVSPRRHSLKSPVRRVNRSPLPSYRRKSFSPLASRKRSLSPVASQLPTSVQVSERGLDNQKDVRDRAHPVTYREPRKRSPVSRSSNSQRNDASPVSKRTSASPKRIDKDPKGPSVSPRRTSDSHTRRRSVTPNVSPKRNASPSSNRRSVSPTTDKNSQRKSSPLIVRYNKPYGDKRRQYQHRNAHSNRAQDFRGAARSRSRSRSISPTSRKDNAERAGSSHFNYTRQNYNQRRRKVVDDRINRNRDNRRRERRSSRDRSDRDKTRDKKEHRDKTRERGRTHGNQKEKDEQQENNEESKTEIEPVEEKSVNSDPVLEARRRKFQSNNPVQPLNKKIRLRTSNNVDDSSSVTTANDKSNNKVETTNSNANSRKEIPNVSSIKKVYVESTSQVEEIDKLTIMKADSSKQDFEFSPEISRADSNKSLDKACNTDDIEEEFGGDSLLLMADDELELEEHLALLEPPKQAKPSKVVAEKRIEPVEKEKKKIKVVKPIARSSVAADKASSPLESEHKEVGARRMDEEVMKKKKERKVVAPSDSKEESDLRAELCRRRAERLTKAGSVHESLPKRLLQSAFVGLIGEKKRLTTKEKLPKSGTQLQSQVHLQTARNTQARSDKVAVPEGGKRRVLLVNRPATRNKANVKISFGKGFESQSDSDDDDDSYNDDNSDAQEDNSDALDNEMESPDETSVVLKSRKKNRSSMRMPIRFRLGVTTDACSSRRRQQVRRLKQVGRFPSIDLDLHGTPSGRDIEIDVTTTD